jgi:hypothetical protein
MRNLALLLMLTLAGCPEDLFPTENKPADPEKRKLAWEALMQSQCNACGEDGRPCCKLSNCPGHNFDGCLPNLTCNHNEPDSSEEGRCRKLGQP